MLGFIHYQQVIKVHKHLPAQSQHAHLKKSVFRIGKKEVARRQTLLQFLGSGLACANYKCACLCGSIITL